MTQRFFDESGRPRTEPTADAGAALWDAYADQVEAELAEEAEPATDYSSPPQSEVADDFDWGSQGQVWCFQVHPLQLLPLLEGGPGCEGERLRP